MAMYYTKIIIVCNLCITGQVLSCDVCQKVNKKNMLQTPEFHPVPVKAPRHRIGCVSFETNLLETKQMC